MQPNNNAATRLYTYEDAGFDGFFRRSIGTGNAMPRTLREMHTGSSYRDLKFDDQQVSGSMGDTFRVGHIALKGKTGQIDIDDDQNVVIIRLGRRGN